MRSPDEVVLQVCPGCGGEWNAAQEDVSLLGTVCSRCGVDRFEAGLLLWGEVYGIYADAHSAAREGRFAEAYRLLHPFLGSPASDANFRGLHDLCAVVSGMTPTTGSGPEMTAARADYETARCLAEQGAFDKSLFYTESCLASIPYLIPAQKLRMLVLAGAGRGVEAESLRSGAASVFTAELDVSRWKFAASLSTVGETSPSGSGALPRVSRRRRSRPDTVQSRRATATGQGKHKQNKEGFYSLPIALGAMTLAAISLMLSLRASVTPQAATASAIVSATVRRPSSVPPVITEADRNILPSAASSNDGYRVLSGELVREWKERRRRADFAQARSWFNRAVRAKNGGNWQECDRLAAAAHHLGKNSYLGDESLVLRALAADNSNASVFIRIARYNAIVKETPNSVYVSWALRRVAQLSEQRISVDKVFDNGSEKR